MFNCIPSLPLHSLTFLDLLQKCQPGWDKRLMHIHRGSSCPESGEAVSPWQPFDKRYRYFQTLGQSFSRYLQSKRPLLFCFNKVTNNLFCNIALSPLLNFQLFHQNSLSQNPLILLLKVLYQISDQTISHCLRISIYLDLRTSLLSRQSEKQDVVFEAMPMGKICFLHYLIIPEKDFNTAVKYIWPVLPYCMVPSINQSQIFHPHQLVSILRSHNIMNDSCSEIEFV